MHFTMDSVELAKQPKYLERSSMKDDQSWKHKLYTIIFEAETPAGKNFDIALLWAIIFSIIVVCLESVKSLSQHYGSYFTLLEWFFTALFTLEYILRIIYLDRPFKYIFSFYGLVDLLATVPTYFSLYFHGAQSLLVIRAIRLLRVFRLLKLTRFVGEADVLSKALLAGRHKITVFLLTVVTIALLAGSIMHLVEGADNGFTSIPKSMYWAIVTMTTVGYGDLAPQTDLGKALASFLMIMGYGIIAVPTGIVSVEMARASSISNTSVCKECFKESHHPDAKYCWSCGNQL